MNRDLSSYILKNLKIDKTCQEAKIKITAELLSWLEAKPVCPKCGEEWTENSFKYYWWLFFHECSEFYFLIFLYVFLNEILCRDLRYL